MRAGPMALKIVVEALGDLVDGEAGSVCGDDSARAAVSGHFFTLVWVTLDDYDNRPKVFWSYVVAALRQAGITVPRVSPAAGRGPADHVFLLRLASMLAAQDPPVVVVLDDLHLVTEQDTLDGLAYMLRNATPGLRLVVSSRMDPLLPLHRYRLAGELTEIRADDLAFSVPESALLMARQGITLPPMGSSASSGGLRAGLRESAWPPSRWRVTPTLTNSLRNSIPRTVPSLVTW